MAVVLAFSIIIHTGLFLSSTGFFWYTAKKENFAKREWAIYLGTSLSAAIMNLCLVVFAVNNLDGLKGTQMAVFGYTAFPVVPIVLLLTTYPVFQILKQQSPSLKYSSVFWGIVLSAPLGYILGSSGSMLGIL